MSDVISKMGDPERLAARLAGERPADIVEALNRGAVAAAAIMSAASVAYER